MHNIVKNTMFPGLLDLIAPHSCRGCGRLGQPICECCKKYIIDGCANFCPCCKTPKIIGKCPKCKDLPPTFFIGERVGLLDQLIHDYKYHSVRALAPQLAELLSVRLPKTLPCNSIIVPLPTATNHIRSRGFDHTQKIASELAKIKKCKTQPVFIRDKNTVQVGADRKTRLVQADRAFMINSKIKIDRDATYIVFDDVWTTGASINAAIKKLRAAGASKIIVAILAVGRLD